MRTFEAYLSATKLNFTPAGHIHQRNRRWLFRMIVYDSKLRVENGKLPRDDSCQAGILAVVVSAVDALIGPAPTQHSGKDMLARPCRFVADDAFPSHQKVPSNLASVTYAICRRNSSDPLHASEVGFHSLGSK